MCIMRAALVVFMFSLLSACVTVNVNIYFPAAAAEKAADKIIDEIWKLENSGANETKADGTSPADSDQPKQ